MWYTENDVLKAYRNAADKSEIIEILCELNSCNREDILSILYKHNILDINGVEIKCKPELKSEPAPKSKIKSKFKSKSTEVNNMSRIKWDADKLIQIQEMLDSGKTQKEIGEFFGVTAGNISAICVKHNIKKNDKSNDATKILDDFKTHQSVEAKVEDAVENSVETSINNPDTSIAESQTGSKCSCGHQCNCIDDLNESKIKKIDDIIDSISASSNVADNLVADIIKNYRHSDFTDFELGLTLSKISIAINDIILKCTEFNLDK